MNVVTYARVSTKAQERGASLEDQERRFQSFLLAGGHTRLKSYAESKSAGTVRQRKTFQLAISELQDLRAIVAGEEFAFVVDSLDRFTRDKFLGVEQFAKIRDAGVKLWELEYSTERPLDLNNPADRDYVWQKFNDAEAERRRIAARQQKRYKATRERGETTTSFAPFGLRRAGKSLVPDPAEAPIVQQVDRMVLEGQSIREVLRWLRPRADAWTTPRGVALALKNTAYVQAGIRSRETQAALLHIVQTNSDRFGQYRKREYEFTGVFLCGPCYAAGLETRMHGHTSKGGASVSCSIFRYRAVPEHSFFVREWKIRPLWLQALRQLRADPGLLRQWSEEAGVEMSRKIEQRIADLDQREAEIAARRSAAFGLLASPNEALRRQAEAYLEAIDRDDQELHVMRQAAYADLSTTPIARDFESIRLNIEKLEAIYENPAITDRERNALNRDLVAVLGYPVLERAGRKKPLTLRWPTSALPTDLVLSEV